MSELAKGTRVMVVRDEPHDAECKAGDIGEVVSYDADISRDMGTSVYEVKMTDGWEWALTEGEDFEVIP